MKEEHLKDQPETSREQEADTRGEKEPCAAAAKISVSEAEYQKLVQEASEFKERWVRLFADFENFRKRVERERRELIKYANQELIIEFLGIMDDLERSVEAANAKHEDYTAFLKGIEMVMARIYDLLKRNEVKAIEAVGKKFDPHCHEILLQMPSAQHEDGVVMEELQRGYLLADRVVRTAKVKVAINRPETSSGDSPASANNDTESGGA